jgi:acylphosphatase
MSEPIARRLRIHGRVQGVWFRESMRLEAEALGVVGWVRNCADGSVEAVVQGAPESVRSMIEWAHRGPDQADVTRVDEAEEPAGFHANFGKRPTA